MNIAIAERPDRITSAQAMARSQVLTTATSTIADFYVGSVNISLLPTTEQNCSNASAVTGLLNK